MLTLTIILIVLTGGVLAIWCYGHCAVAPEVDSLLRDIYASVDDYWPPERDIVESEYRGIVLPLAEIDCPSYAMKIEWTVGQMLAYIRTWSASQAALRATGKDPMNRQLDDSLESYREPISENKSNSFDKPF